MDVTDVCRQIWRCGGAARTSDLSAGGRPMQKALDSGRVVRLARGVYAPSSQEAPLRAAAGLAGVASHTSAAQLWLMDVVHAPTRPHVTVRRNRRLGPVDVTPHRADLAAGDVDGMVTTPLRTVVDRARSLPFPEALAVGDSTCRRGLVTGSELLARAEVTRGAGRAAVLRVAHHASAEPANPFESALRGIALDAGVDGLAPQRWVQGRSGWVRPDLVDERLRMVAEADSFEWHGERSALAADCRRYDDLVAVSWTVLRFAWEQVVFDQGWVAGVLRDTAARLGGPAGVQKSA